MLEKELNGFRFICNVLENNIGFLIMKKKINFVKF